MRVYCLLNKVKTSTVLSKTLQSSVPFASECITKLKFGSHWNKKGKWHKCKRHKPEVCVMCIGWDSSRSWNVSDYSWLKLLFICLFISLMCSSWLLCKPISHKQESLKWHLAQILQLKSATVSWSKGTGRILRKVQYRFLRQVAW